MKVIKFGGGSLENYENMYNSARVVKKRCQPGDIVVVSALGGVTDKLIEAGKKAHSGQSYYPFFKDIKSQHDNICIESGVWPRILDDDFSALENTLKNPEEDFRKWLDLVESFGEKVSSKLFAAFLARETETDARPFFTGNPNVGYFVSDNHGDAEPLPEVSREKVRENFLGQKFLAIVSGYIGVNPEKREIYTGGRGASDLVATQIANYLGAEGVELWTHVNGVMTANPAIVPNAKTISDLCYEEAEQLSRWGAKLHPRCIPPAREADMPIYVFNTLDPEGAYTVIGPEQCEIKGVVKGITMDPKVNDIIIKVKTNRMVGGRGFLKLIGEGAEELDIGLTSSSENSISFTIGESDAEILESESVKKLKKIGIVETRYNRKNVFAVGRGMEGTAGVSGRLFSAVGKEGINIELISQGNEINIGFAVKAEDAEKAVRAVHKEFFE